MYVCCAYSVLRLIFDVELILFAVKKKKKTREEMRC